MSIFGIKARALGFSWERRFPRRLFRIHADEDSAFPAARRLGGRCFFPFPFRVFGVFRGKKCPGFFFYSLSASAWALEQAFDTFFVC